jgi:hypothetical protein
VEEGVYELLMLFDGALMIGLGIEEEALLAAGDDGMALLIEGAELLDDTGDAAPSNMSL